MKKLMLFAMWLAASGAAVATAWAGVSVVDNQVAPPSVIGLERGDTELAIQRPDGSVASTSSSLDLSPSSDPTNSAGLSIDGSDSTSTDGSTVDGVAGPTATSTGSRPLTTQGPQLPATNAPTTNTPATNAPSTNAAPSSSAGASAPATSGATQPPATQPSTSQATTSTTRPTTSTTQPTTSTTQPTTSTTQGATTKTFNLVGGSTAVSFSPSGVQVLWATPKPGFDVEIENEGSGMKVEFESDDHRSRVDVWWSGGPRHDIRERAD